MVDLDLDLAYAVLAVDPGDKHVGLASWVGGPEPRRETGEVSHDEVVKRFTAWHQMYLPNAQILVVEEFRLYAHKAQQQKESEMLTAQLIGVLKHVAGELGVQVVLQPAGIKKATRRQLRARKIKQIGRGGHARDAELHLMHFLIKEKLWKS